MNKYIFIQKDSIVINRYLLWFDWLIADWCLILEPLLLHNNSTYLVVFIDVAILTHAGCIELLMCTTPRLLSTSILMITITTHSLSIVLQLLVSTDVVAFGTVLDVNLHFLLSDTRPYYRLIGLLWLNLFSRWYWEIRLNERHILVEKLFLLSNQLIL
jgi:hypothetical protein